MMSKVGIVKSVKKVKDGLLVETNSDSQSRKLLELENFNNCQITVTPHGSLNFVKGVITCRDLLNCSLVEIIEHLSDQGVVDAKRIMVKREGNLEETASIILTFNRLSLPDRIKAGIYRSIPVRPYIPAPLRCYRCQGYGHTSSRCDKQEICICGLEKHDGTLCQDPMKCINCGGQHSSRSKNCPKFKEEVEIQKIKVTEKISFSEARRKVQRNNPHPSVSYAQAVRNTDPIVTNIVNQIIPEIKNICEKLVQESQTRAKPLNSFVRPQGLPYRTPSSVSSLAAGHTSAPEIPSGQGPSQPNKRKKGEVTSKSASEASDSEESVFSSQLNQEETVTEKPKRGWRKGRPRNPNKKALPSEVPP